MRRPTPTPAKIVLLSLLSISLWWVFSGPWRAPDPLLLEALERYSLGEVRGRLNDVVDWGWLLRDLDARRDTRLYQRLLDAAAEDGRRGDDHGAYPLTADVVRHLVEHGARPGYRHLNAAVESGAEDTARYLRERGMPAPGTEGQGD